MTTPEEIVEDFIFSYKGWLDDGSPEGKPFMRGDDLEQNMSVTLRVVGIE